MLAVLLIRGVTLPGAAQGIQFYLYPNITRLWDPQVRSNYRATTWLWGFLSYTEYLSSPMAPQVSVMTAVSTMGLGVLPSTDVCPHGVPQMTVVSMAGVGMLPSADVGQQLLVVIRCLPLFVLALQPPRGLGPWQSYLGTTNTTQHCYWQAAPLSPPQPATLCPMVPSLLPSDLTL